jgi:polar amino acid transport system substrate-binding protein
MQRFNQRLQAFRDSGRYDRYFHDLQAGKYMLTEEEATQASAE